MGTIKQGSDLHIIHIKQIEPPVTLIQPSSPSFALSISSKNMAVPTTAFKLENLKKNLDCLLILMDGACQYLLMRSIYYFTQAKVSS